MAAIVCLGQFFDNSRAASGPLDESEHSNFGEEVSSEDGVSMQEAATEASREAARAGGSEGERERWRLRGERASMMEGAMEAARTGSQRGLEGSDDGEGSEHERSGTMAGEGCGSQPRGTNIMNTYK